MTSGPPPYPLWELGLGANRDVTVATVIAMGNKLPFVSDQRTCISETVGG